MNNFRILVPKSVLTSESVIVNKRVEPDINHLLVVNRAGYSPRQFKLRARDRNVLNSLLNKSEHFCPAVFRNYKVRRTDELPQKVRILCPLKKIIFFSVLLNLAGRVQEALAGFV